MDQACSKHKGWGMCKKNFGPKTRRYKINLKTQALNVDIKMELKEMGWNGMT